MKTKILFLFLIISSLITAQTKKPPHSFPGMTCKTCHICDIPTKENPCVRPCPRDMMIQIEETPKDAPSVIKIDKLNSQSKVYSPVIFTHRLHSEMSGMSGGCKMCHHYNPPGEVIVCSECHELSRKRVDISKPDLKGAYHRLCMNCHRSWSGSTDCVSCHKLNGENKSITEKQITEITAKKVHPKLVTPKTIKFDTPKASVKTLTFNHSEHINTFGFECQRCHSNESCDKCHAKNKTAGKEKTREQKHVVCSNCHDTKSKENCSSCHTETPAGFDHKAVTGFDNSLFHSKLACIRCHTEKGKFTGLKNECENCHGVWTQQNFKHKLTGVILDENHSSLECKDCHQEKDYSKPVCNNCHDDKSYPQVVPGKLVKKN